MSQQHPDLSRVFGLFLGEDTAPEKMAAFSWFLNNGDHGEYRAAGSNRRIESPVPLGYLPVWEVIRWAKAMGAEWFDMGGVTLEGADEIGSEWAMEPAPAKARIASVASNAASRLRDLKRKWRSSGHTQA